MKTPGYIRLLLAGCLILASQSFSHAADRDIPHAGDLTAVNHSSGQVELPILVFVSRDACPYCRELRKSVLGPMYAAGKFDQRAVLLEVNIDHEEPLTGFDGETVTAKDFAEQYKAVITPTLLFLDGQGRQLSKPRIGISNLDLYVFYLNKSIDESLARLANPQ